MTRPGLGHHSPPGGGRLRVVVVSGVVIGAIVALGLVSASRIRELRQDHARGQAAAAIVGIGEKTDEVATQMMNMVEKLEVTSDVDPEDRREEPADLRSDIAAARERLAAGRLPVSTVGPVEGVLQRAEVIANRAERGERVRSDALELEPDLRAAAESLVVFGEAPGITALVAARSAAVELHATLTQMRESGLEGAPALDAGDVALLDRRIGVWRARFAAVRGELDATAIDEDDALFAWQPPRDLFLESQVGRSRAAHADWVEGTGDELDDLGHIVEEIDDHIGDAASARAESDTVLARMLQGVLGGSLALLGGLAFWGARQWRRRRAIEWQLRDLAIRDPLTGLFNRSTMASQFTEMRRGGRWPLALVFMDLDDFKSINDREGHGVGDEVLRRTAQRVCDVVRADDVVFRLGGDEMVVLAPSCDQADADDLVERIRSAVAAPLELDDRRVQLSTSLGVRIVTSAEESLDVALHDADGAMYRAKAQRREGGL